MRPLFAVIAALGVVACEPAPADVRELGTPVPLSVMTYNLASISGMERDGMAAQVAEISPEIIAVQECVECAELAANLPGSYALSAPARSEVGIVYDQSRWQVDRTGLVVLARDDDGWGERVAAWALLSHLETWHRVYVYSTHWCSPWRSFFDTCDESRQLEYAEAVMSHIDHREFDAPTLIMGDLNVLDGFENGRVVRALLDGGFADVFRRNNPNADGTTFVGNDIAPAGRLDYILATEPVFVIDSWIADDTPVVGVGSDHFPVVASLLFE